MAVLGVAGLVLFGAFYLWQTPGARLSATEIDEYLGSIDAQLQTPAADKAQLIARLRAWAQADDGQPIYMLNLMRFHDELQPYPGVAPFDGTPQEANTYYEATLAPVILKRGGYPFFRGSADGANLLNAPAALDHWNDVVVMRHPSRRAFLDFLSDPAYAAVEPLKLMAQDVVLVPIKADAVIPDLRWVLGSVLLILWLAIGWWRATRRSTAR